MGGSISICTCWLASLEVDWPICSGWDCMVCARASSMVCTESGYVKSLEVSENGILCADERGKEITDLDV